VTHICVVCFEWIAEQTVMVFVTKIEEFAARYEPNQYILQVLLKENKAS
jgi:hypothetical protein